MSLAGEDLDRGQRARRVGDELQIQHAEGAGAARRDRERWVGQSRRRRDDEIELGRRDVARKRAHSEPASRSTRRTVTAAAGTAPATTTIARSNASRFRTVSAAV